MHLQGLGLAAIDKLASLTELLAVTSDLSAFIIKASLISLHREAVSALG